MLSSIPNLLSIDPQVEQNPTTKKIIRKEDKNTIMVLPGLDRLLNLFDVFLSLYAFRTFTIQNIFIRNILDI